MMDPCKEDQVSFHEQHQVSFPKGRSWRTQAPLELGCADICDKMTTPLSQNIYFLIFVEGYA